MDDFKGPLVTFSCVFAETMIFMIYAGVTRYRLRQKIIDMGRLIPTVQLIIANSNTVVPIPIPLIVVPQPIQQPPGWAVPQDLPPPYTPSKH